MGEQQSVGRLLVADHPVDLFVHGVTRRAVY